MSERHPLDTTSGARPEVGNPLEPLATLLRDLRSQPQGLSSREATQRLVAYGRNELRRRGGRRWPRQLLAQLVHPLALLLWLAALLAFANRTPVIGVAVVAIVVLNAAFAFAQERQAERAVEALNAYLPQQVTVFRDRRPCVVEAAELVPGDVIAIEEGDRISADARLLEGSVEIDLSTLTGESQPVSRAAAAGRVAGPLREARDVVFSGSACVGSARLRRATSARVRDDRDRSR